MTNAIYSHSSTFIPERINLSLDLMAQTLEQVAQPIALTDGDGKFWYVNQAMIQLLEIPSAVLLASSLTEHLQGAEMLRWLLPRAINEGWSGELTLRRSDQSEILTQATLRPLRISDPGRSMLTWSFSDLTQQKQLEAQLQAENQELLRSSQLKSEFLANMSHELRTPLTSILGFSSILKQQIFGALTPKQDTYTQRIYRSGEHLLALINDILDLSKIEAGQLALDYSPLSVSQVCLEAIALVSEQAKNRKLTLHSTLPEALPPLLADEVRLRQMLLNLLSNAIKFSHEGGQIGLEVQAQETHLSITVWDQGIGIPLEKQHLMFQPFKQLDDNTARRHLGTGLGLALTKRLVELHHGTIEFSSQSDQGSRFTLHIPLDPSAIGLST